MHKSLLCFEFLAHSILASVPSMTLCFFSLELSQQSKSSVGRFLGTEVSISDVSNFGLGPLLIKKTQVLRL